MRVQVCPKCGRPMNVAFAFFTKDDKSIKIQCPNCRHNGDDGVVDTLYLEDDIVETRAGLEGVEAQVRV